MSRDIILSLIDTDPAQPRKHFDGVKIAELAESMHGNGLIVPIMVRPVGDRFVIVHGERRYRAAVSLGWATIPADVRELDSEAARWFALVENIQRADLSPIEEANAYKAMLDTGITQTELGKRIGKGQSYIATKLRLLTLPGGVQESIDKGELTEGHAKQLLRLNKAPFETCGWVYRAVTNYGLTVAATSALVDCAFDLVAMIEAIQSGDMVKANALLRKMPYLPKADEDLEGGYSVEYLLRLADTFTTLALCGAPARSTVVRADEDYEMTENDQKWVDTVVAMELLKRSSEQNERDLHTAGLHYALCLREASLIDLQGGQFSQAGAHTLLGLANLQPADVGRHLSPLQETYLIGKLYNGMEADRQAATN